MTTIPNVLSIQDYCSVGRCALAVTIPVLSSLGIQTVALPTSIFSNTPFFEHMAVKELTKESYEFLEAWEKNHFTFSAIQSGFLSSPEQTGIVKDAIRRFGGEGVLTVIDPAMADHGNLYPVFDDSIIIAMKDLLKEAQVITPNYTEAIMLTEGTYTTEPMSLEAIKKLCVQLHQQGPKQVVITSIPTEADKIRTAVLDMTTEAFTIIDTDRIPMNAPGTGDIFTAMLTGSMLRGHSLEEACRRAVTFTYKTIKHTHTRGGEPLLGVYLEEIVPTQKP